MGCATQSDGVKILTEDNTQTVYLLSGAEKKVKAGERLVLRGKKSRDATGRDVFQVRKVAKDDGPCETQSVREGNSP